MADGGGAPTYMLAVKQYNDGTAYVISPYELPWLSHYLELKVDRSNHSREAGGSPFKLLPARLSVHVPAITMTAADE